MNVCVPSTGAVIVTVSRFSQWAGPRANSSSSSTSTPKRISRCSRIRRRASSRTSSTDAISGFSASRTGSTSGPIASSKRARNCCRIRRRSPISGGTPSIASRYSFTKSLVSSRITSRVPDPILAVGAGAHERIGAGVAAARIAPAVLEVAPDLRIEVGAVERQAELAPVGESLVDVRDPVVEIAREHAFGRVAEGRLAEGLEVEAVGEVDRGDRRERDRALLDVVLHVLVARSEAAILVGIQEGLVVRVELRDQDLERARDRTRDPGSRLDDRRAQGEHRRRS